MAANAATGSFNITTAAATNTVTVSGLGFTPVAVIFWWSGRTDSTDASGGATAIEGVGFAVSTTDRRCVCGWSEDAQGTSNSANYQSEAACIIEIDDGGLVGAADVSAFNSGEFVVVIDTQFTTDLRVSYLALGGEINSAETGSFVVASAGNLDVATTDVPECVLFIATRQATATEAGGVHNQVTLMGAATGPSNEFTTSVFDRDARTTTIAYGYTYGAECCSSARPTGLGEPESRCEFTDFAPVSGNGFSVEVLEAANDRAYYFLALAGGDYHVGDFVTATDTSNFSQTGVGFEPVAVMFASNCKAEDAQDVTGAETKHSLGAATSATERTAQAFSSQNGLATSEVFTAIEHDELYVRPDLADGVEGLMDLVSMDSDGFTTVMDDADPGAAFVGFIAFGPAAAAGESVTPVAQTALWAIQAPAVTLGAVSHTPVTQTALWAIQAPLTSNTVTPPAQTAVFAVQAPVVTTGAVSHTPAVQTAQWSIQAPTITAGAISVTPVSQSAAWTITAPSVTRGGLTVTPAVQSAAWSIQNPAVTEGGLSVVPVVQSAAWSIQSPVITVGGVSVTPVAQTAEWAVHAIQAVEGFTGAVTGTATMTAAHTGEIDIDPGHQGITTIGGAVVGTATVD